MLQSFISLALLMATILVAGFFAYIYRIKRQTYLLLWTSAWTFFGLHYLGSVMSPGTPSSATENALNHWLYALAGLLFFLGTQLYAQRKPWKTPAALVAVLLGLWAAANAANILFVSVVIPSSLVYIGVAVLFWQESRRQETLADRLLSLSFASWGLLWISV
jgi:hypothetical protein